jgi:hypothetical protein
VHSYKYCFSEEKDSFFHDVVLLTALAATISTTKTTVITKIYHSTALSKGNMILNSSDRFCVSRGLFFLIRIVGGGIQLGPLGTSDTENLPILPAPGDYDDGEFGGMMIGRGNRSARRKPAPLPLCLPQIPHDLTGREPGPPRWKASD